jgi:hypothetical protein
LAADAAAFDDDYSSANWPMDERVAYELEVIAEIRVVRLETVGPWERNFLVAK